MFGQFGAITRQLSTRRLAQSSSFVSRGFEEFFEKGQRLPTGRDQTGRSWAASELRQKSWEDLQKLWYVVLKERNMLASQKEESRRLGVHGQFFSNKSRIIKCKQTMARIKSVLGEREIAWKKAQEELAAQAVQQKGAIAAGKTASATESTTVGATEVRVPEVTAA
ncbi:54S ribosomal protein L4 mitochondrial [Kickxella alabastrina]|uniref:54S ribosomal protein L4 mitochondrial n=1 Tax=Kickxella alabastrina TaxID=61397 RepID=A0ACC1IBS2_9FUNG|nr:54S ribosomal protein L4 mitochondrial [Kickxella alabastrina]